MKTAHKTQKAIILTFGLLSAAGGQDLSPEAWHLIEALERRIDAGRADQASLDILLASLAPEEGCADWVEEVSWKGEPDLRAVLAEVCPDRPRPPRRSAAKGLRLDLSAEESVRPSALDLPGPSLAGSLRGSRGGIRLAANPEGVRTRQATLAGPSWRAQAGRLDLGNLPYLAFVSGRRAFAGGGWTAGPGGALAAASSSLDGLAGSVAAGRFQVAAFGAWNRRTADPGPAETGVAAEAVGRREDALAYSLAAGWRSGAWQGTVQSALIRLEVPDRDPAAVILGGLRFRRSDPGLRLGFAGSGLRPGGAAADRPFEPGAYVEAAWEEGKPGGYRMEAWQATTGWASPLAARPALSRDTADPGLPLPGRGEGGTRLRSELGLLEAEDLAVRLQAAAMAGWTLVEASHSARSAHSVHSDLSGGFLAGEGRAGLILVAGPWTSETTWGKAWRREGLAAAGSRLTSGQRLAWEGKRWRGAVAWSRREAASGRASQPAELEIGRSIRGGGRWQARLTARDARFPARHWRFDLDQDWPLGSGLRMSHALRLPLEAGELSEDFGYRVKLAFAGW